MEPVSVSLWESRGQVQVSEGLIKSSSSLPHLQLLLAGEDEGHINHRRRSLYLGGGGKSETGEQPSGQG